MRVNEYYRLSLLATLMRLRLDQHRSALLDKEFIVRGHITQGPRLPKGLTHGTQEKKLHPSVTSAINKFSVLSLSQGLGQEIPDIEITHSEHHSLAIGFLIVSLPWTRSKRLHGPYSPIPSTQCEEVFCIGMQALDPDPRHPQCMGRSSLTQTDTETENNRRFIWARICCRDPEAKADLHSPPMLGDFLRSM